MTKIEIGIMETATEFVSNVTILPENPNLRRSEKDQLRRRVNELNESLRRKGEHAEEIRRALATNPWVDNTVLREWEQARWSGDAPDKDKHHVLVEREVHPWTEVDSGVKHNLTHRSERSRL